MSTNGIISFNISNLQSGNSIDTVNNIEHHEEEVISNKDNRHHDISLIQCFWGTDIRRISSSIQTLINNLKNFNPENINEWIFVEAQTDRKLACFNWVTTYGLKYKFVKIPKDSEDIFIKMPLWNIGTVLATSDNLCFIDSDIYFKNSQWIESVEDAFTRYDIIQLHGYIENNGDRIESLGHKIKDSKNLDFEIGHGGHTLGIKRSVFTEIGGFDATNYLDDQWFWVNMIGYNENSERFFKLPYKPKQNYGKPYTIGSTEETIVHTTHGNTNINTYDLAHEFSYAVCHEPFADIEYIKDMSSLPHWKNTPTGRIMKNCIHDILNGKANRDTLIHYQKKEYGEIDNEHPLIIVTSYINRNYIVKNTDYITELHENLKKRIKNDFHFICISNEKIDNIDTIPLKNKNTNILEFVFGKKIHYPKNSTVVYMDVNNTVDRDIEFYGMTNTKNILIGNEVREYM